MIHYDGCVRDDYLSTAPTEDIMSAIILESANSHSAGFMTSLPRRSASPLVLVADDHDDSRTIARLVLETAGWRVVEARTGTETLRLVREQQPDALLLDIVMPEVNGWEVARRLRADDVCRSTIIIALTALAGSYDREQSFAAGCDDLLTKPVHPRTLLATLRRHVGEPLA